jgi:hypothetical protein
MPTFAKQNTVNNQEELHACSTNFMDPPLSLSLSFTLSKRVYMCVCLYKKVNPKSMHSYL